MHTDYIPIHYLIPIINLKKVDVLIFLKMVVSLKYVQYQIKVVYVKKYS